MSRIEGRSWRLKSSEWIKAAFKILRSLFFCFAIYVAGFSERVVAQAVSAILKADSNHIVIGDFLNLKLIVKSPAEFIIAFPLITDTLGNLELITASKIDTSINGNIKSLSQTFTVSAYDSGTYHAGPQKILFKNQNGTIDSIFSDSLLIEVSTVPVDTSKSFKAIKAPIDVPYTFSEFLPYIIGGMAAIAILAGAIYYIRSRRKKKPKIIERLKPKDPAPSWARKELKKLEEEKLWQKDEIKLYFSRLSDILRLYLEYRYNWFALESTTEEISENIDSYKVSKVAKENLLFILGEADLVKFAKRIPMPDTNIKAMEFAYRFIELTELKEMRTEEKANV